MCGCNVDYQSVASLGHTIMSLYFNSITQPVKSYKSHQSYKCDVCVSQVPRTSERKEPID